MHSSFFTYVESENDRVVYVYGYMQNLYVILYLI